MKTSARGGSEVLAVCVEGLFSFQSTSTTFSGAGPVTYCDLELPWQLPDCTGLRRQEKGEGGVEGNHRMILRGKSMQDVLEPCHAT
jgi:hypothetical protein